MAIAFDNFAGPFLVNPGTSISGSHTVGSGNYMMLFLGILIDNNNILTAKYNNIDMTLITAFQEPSSTRWLFLYCLPNPTPGSNTVAVTANSSELIQIFTVSYSGVNQSVTMDNKTTNNNPNTTSLSTSLTTVQDNCWTLLFGRAGSNTIGAGAGTTQRVASSFTGFFDSNAVVHPPGSNTLIITSTTSGNFVESIMVSLAPQNSFDIAFI